jgi:hypothetical protein
VSQIEYTIPPTTIKPTAIIPTMARNRAHLAASESCALVTGSMDKEKSDKG